MRSLTPHPVPDAVSRAFLPEGFAPEGVPDRLVHEKTLRLVRCAFSPKLNIEFFLACLLRYATLDPRTTMQPSLFSATGESQDIALIFILSVEALANSPNWRWGPETTHKMLLVLEALHVIRRVFHRTYTEIHFFLGEREIPLPEILSSLQTLHDTKKNKKVRQIARKAMKRLRQQSGELVARSPKGTTLAHGLNLIAQVISGVLRGHGIDERKDNHELLDQASLVIGHVLQPETFPLPNGRVAAQLGEFLATLSEQRLLPEAQSGEFPTQLGDSVDRDTTATNTDRSASGSQKGDLVTTESPVSLTDGLKIQHIRRRNLLCEGQLGDSFACETTESPNCPRNLPFPPLKGDSVADALSSRESINIIKNSKGTEKIDIEKDASVPERSPEDIRAEATYLWSHLYTQEQRQEPGGDRFVGGFISRLQDHSDLVRASMINVLFQRVFPDKKFGPPQGGGSQWFYRTYKRYAAGTLAISGEIQSWLDSPYSYSQIESTLKKESERQQRDNAERERAHLPCYGYLIRPCADQYDEINGISEDGAHEGDEPGEEEGSVAEGESSPPMYPAPWLPWTVETVLALFDFWRGYQLTGEEDVENAIGFAEDVVNGRAEASIEPYTRFQVEYTYRHFQSYPQLWVAMRPQGDDGHTGIPDIWFITSVMEDIWPQLRAYLLETAQCVELDDGELLTYEEYQALYERAQQVAQEEKLTEAPLSFAEATLEYQRLMDSGTHQAIVEEESTAQVEEYQEPKSAEGAWSLQQAQEQAAMVRDKLAGEAYAVLVATEQGGQGSLLVYSRTEQQVVARLTREEDCEQAMVCLCGQAPEPMSTERVEAHECR